VKLIPGVRQDHTGFNYQLGIDDAGNQHRIPYVEENPKQYPQLEPVVKTTKSTLPHEESPAVVLQKLANGSLYREGEQFNSIALFQRN
jgi:hypothetical protein